MRVIKDGKVVEAGYKPPAVPQREAPPTPAAPNSEALISAIITGFRSAMLQIPPPVVHAPQPEVKVNSPVYVQPPEIRIPATTVNVPEGKAPVVNIEPAAVTLQTIRPKKWIFTFHRDEFGRVTTVDAETP